MQTEKRSSKQLSTTPLSHWQIPTATLSRGQRQARTDLRGHGKALRLLLRLPLKLLQKRRETLVFVALKYLSKGPAEDVKQLYDHCKLQDWKWRWFVTLRQFRITDAVRQNVEEYNGIFDWMIWGWSDWSLNHTITDQKNTKLF